MYIDKQLLVLTTTMSLLYIFHVLESTCVRSTAVCKLCLQVKNKYLKEQKVDPARVREAMSGRQTATLAQLTSLAQPGTAAAGIVAMLPGGDNAVGENSVMAEELDDAEGDDEYLSVNPIANEFYY